MKRFFTAILLSFAILSSAHAAEKQPLKVVFLSKPGIPHTTAYMKFLQERFAKADLIERSKFDVSKAHDYDVVILDWPQDGGPMQKSGGPLGDRAAWDRPTVLVGSAGLRLACAWETKGGFGCTCLQPFAFDLRDHPLFQTPNVISRQMVTKSVPEAWVKRDGKETADVVALVRDIKGNFSPGWATHIDELLDSPDVEVMSGGINDQTPTSAAIWRQGNLTHFGFDQDPDEMNDTGRDLLENTIVYASHFSQDRPIAMSPSIFVDDEYPRTRRRIGRWLDTQDLTFNDIKSRFFKAPGVKDVEGAKKWFKENRAYLHADQDGLLVVDEDARRLGWTVGDLGGVNDLILKFETDPSVRPLLKRYLPDMPLVPTSAGFAVTSQWWAEHHDYLFFSEDGGYRFYIDPLAMKRHIPTAKLRGVDRADVKSTDHE